MICIKTQVGFCGSAALATATSMRNTVHMLCEGPVDAIFVYTFDVFLIDEQDGHHIYKT